MEHPAGPQARICPRARPNNALQLPRLSLLLQNFSFPRVGPWGEVLGGWGGRPTAIWDLRPDICN